jgi:hypothetical protein
VGLQGRKSRLHLWGCRASRTGDPVAVGLAFPAIPHDLLAVASPGLQGFSVTSAILGRSLGMTAFMAFASPTECSRERWNRLSLVPPLLGFECCPPAGIPHARPLPGAEAPFGPALLHASSRSALVVSHHLDVFLRARVTGLLHPATSKGFAAFPVCRRPLPSEDSAVCRGHSPRRGSHPSKSSPHQQPYRITAAFAFLPLPSCPARVPTEAGVLADRRTPGRATYTRISLPVVRRMALPRGGGCPARR